MCRLDILWPRAEYPSEALCASVYEPSIQPISFLQEKDKDREEEEEEEDEAPDPSMQEPQLPNLQRANI